MTDSSFNRSIVRALVLAGVLGAGCSSGGEDTPPPVAETGGSEESTGSTTTPVATEDSGPAATSESGLESESSAESGSVEDCVLNADGCFGEECVPTVREHLLNRCTAAACEPFDNTQKRLPRLNNDGTLPPLP